MELKNETLERKAQTDKLLSRPVLESFRESWIGGTSVAWDDPRVNMLHADLTGLPPTMIYYGEDESPVQPFHLHPAGDGLVPWGGTDNGDVLYWHKGIREPERWPIVCYSMRDGDHSTFDLSATEFLVSLLSKQIVVPQFPEDWFDFEGLQNSRRTATALKITDQTPHSRSRRSVPE
jgi:hypothetical protein